MTEKLVATGACEPCPAGARASSDGRRCTPANCSPKERLAPGGICVACPEFTRPSSDGTSCTHNKCSERQRHKSDGSCVRCPEYERAQTDGDSCAPDECNVAVEVELTEPASSTSASGKGPGLAIDGKTSTTAETTIGGAGAFWKADFAGGTALSISEVKITADASSAGAIVEIEDEECGPLPSDIRPGREVTVICQRPLMGTFVKIKATHPSKPLRLAEVVVMSSSKREVNAPDGRCVACPLYTRPEDSRNCEESRCNALQYLTFTGWCATCPPYTKALSDGRSCGPDSCSGL